MLEQELVKYGYLLIFAGTIMEGDAVLLASAFLAHRGRFRLDFVLLTACAATLIANHVYYYMARNIQSPWLVDMLKHGRGKQVHEWVDRRSGTLLFFSRFMPGFRTLVPLACGVSAMRPPLFAAINFASAVVWTAVLGLLGYFSGHTVELLIDDIRRHEPLIVAIVLAAALIALLIRSRDTLRIWMFLRSALR